MRVTTRMFLLGILVLGLAPGLLLAQPTSVSYQGQLEKDGAPFSGQADFMFAIVDSARATVLWSNDGNSPPTTPVVLEVEQGLFQVLLGDGDAGMLPLTASLLEGAVNPKLRIWVRAPAGTGQFEQLSDQKIASVPFSLRTEAGGAGGECLWETNGTDVYRLGGNVGIGTSTPTSPLTIATSSTVPMNVTTTDATARFILKGTAGSSLRASGSETDRVLSLQASPSGNTGAFLELNGKDKNGSYVGNGGVLLATAREGDGDIAFQVQDASQAMTIKASARVGIGTASPTAHLELAASGGNAGPWAVFRGGGGILENVAFRLYDTGTANGNRNILEFAHGNAGQPAPVARIVSQSVGPHSSGGASLTFQVASDNAGNFVQDQLVLDPNGRTKVKVLQITGGSDLAEPFDVSPDLTKTEIQEGMVVAIDPDRPGELRVASEPYDSKVAGVLSGANGLAPGLMMKADGCPLGDGQHPVALSGRVWCCADASYGSIRPGDLLTSSGTPGHAMKAIDRERCHGAILGKAMTGLEQGQGYVLVLVNLQ